LFLDRFTVYREKLSFDNANFHRHPKENTDDNLLSKDGGQTPQEFISIATSQAQANQLVQYNAPFNQIAVGIFRRGKIVKYGFHVPQSQKMPDGRKGRFRGRGRHPDTGYACGDLLSVLPDLEAK
jgi:hypothetical protein